MSFPDWLVMGGQPISYGFPAVLQQSAKKKADALGKRGTTKPKSEVYMTLTSRKSSTDAIVKKNIQAHNNMSVWENHGSHHLQASHRP
jgi:hypothetical protein